MNSLCPERHRKITCNLSGEILGGTAYPSLKCMLFFNLCGSFYKHRLTLILTRISNYIHYIKCGMKFLSIPKLQRLNRWSLGIDKKFHPSLYWACNLLIHAWYRNFDIRFCYKTYFIVMFPKRQIFGAGLSGFDSWHRLDNFTAMVTPWAVLFMITEAGGTEILGAMFAKIALNDW